MEIYFSFMQRLKKPYFQNGRTGYHLQVIFALRTAYTQSSFLNVAQALVVLAVSTL